MVKSGACRATTGSPTQGRSGTHGWRNDHGVAKAWRPAQGQGLPSMHARQQ